MILLLTSCIKSLWICFFTYTEIMSFFQNYHTELSWLIHDIFHSFWDVICSKYFQIIYESESHSVVPISLWPHGLYSPWNSPGQNTGAGSFPLLQEMFLTQGSNPGLMHSWKIFYQQNQQGSPRILEWVAYPFSSRSSWPRNWTGVFCIAGGLFNNWAIREALYSVQFTCWMTLSHDSCLTLCDPMNCSMPGLPVHHQLPESTQTHVHWVSDSIQPSHPLSSPSLPALNLS